MMLPAMAQAQTLEECQRAAEGNYPLIRQYGLIEKATSLNVANIQKGWLYIQLSMDSSPIKSGQNRPKQTLNQIA